MTDLDTDLDGARAIPNEPDDPPTERYTDAGNAKRLVNAHARDLRYVGGWDDWLTWDGRRWKRDTMRRVVEHAKHVVANIRHEQTGDTEKLLKWALQSESASRIRAMIELARSDPRVAVEPQQLDAKPWLLNTTNGTVDLRTGTRRDHNPRDLLTKITAAEHSITATSPRWEAFLERILPDPDVREFIRRWLGYCLTGAVSEHKIVFAYGAGANGKSTLLNAVARAIGDYGRQAAPDLLMRQQHEPHPTGLADLHGARLVLATETAEDRRLDEALVKRLTGGDRIKARHMMRDFFEFDPTHKFVVATNHRPQIAGTDHGIWRRIRLVPFTVTIPDDEQDRDLEAKLADENDGILGWLIDGCLAWQRSGLPEPGAIMAATAEYRESMDVLGDFISDCCVLAPPLAAKASDLFRRYGQWCEVVGERAVSQRKFGLQLSERGLVKDKSGVVWWQGIGLKSEESEPSPGPYDPNARRETADQRLDF